MHILVVVVFFIKIIITISAVKMQKSGTGPFFYQLALMVASFTLIFLWQRYLIYKLLKLKQIYCTFKSIVVST